MTQFYEKNPEKHPNRVTAKLGKNNKTYPEKVINEKLEKLDVNFEYNKRILTYYPDFLLKDYDVIIEVDGEQWHSKKERIKHDKKRDKKLEKEGYEIHRIPAKNVLKNFRELSDKDEFPIDFSKCSKTQ